jgi:hypothetical protein
LIDQEELKERKELRAAFNNVALRPNTQLGIKKITRNDNAKTILSSQNFNTLQNQNYGSKLLRNFTINPETTKTCVAWMYNDDLIKQ